MADILIGDFSNGSITTESDGTFSWTGTGIFDKLMTAINSNIRVQYDNGRITGDDYATVYLGMAQTAINASMGFLIAEKEIEAKIAVMEKQAAVMEKQAAVVEKQALDLQKQIEIKEYQLATLLPDEHTKNTKQLTILDKQATLIDAQKDGRLEETKYTNARKRIALSSRIDNLLLEALKAQMQQIATVGAGGLTPGEEDFRAANTLREAVYIRAKNGVANNNSIILGEPAETTLTPVEGEPTNISFFKAGPYVKPV
jgi:hypothetical protein